MALKKFNPTTPGQRQLVLVDRSALYKGKPVKALTTAAIDALEARFKCRTSSRAITTSSSRPS